MHHEKIARASLALLGTLALACGGCAGAAATRGDTARESRSDAPQLVMEPNTTRLEGWLSARGEWMLYPTNDFAHYQPFAEHDNEKCVSLVNATGQPRENFAGLEGAYVLVTGSVVRYDDLPIGRSIADQLLSKRYWNDEVVMDSCLRRMVFVVEKLATLDR